MKDKIQKLIAEIIGDGFTVEIKPVASGNVSSDFGAGVTTYLTVYTDDDGGQAIYVNGKLECSGHTVYGVDVARVADGRLVRMRSAVLSEAFDPWPENESELKDMIDGYQAGVDAGAAIGAPDRDGLALRSQWNSEQGCFQDSFVEPEKEWVPKPFEWVVLPDGKVRRCIDHEFINGSKYYCFEGTNTSWDSVRLKPWKPKCGDWVKISKPPASERIARWFWTLALDRLDGETRQITRIPEGIDAGYQVREIDGSGLWLSLSWLEPAEAPADHIADANKMVNCPAIPDSSMPDPGEGYRLLSKDPPEDLQPGDDFHNRGKWLRSTRADDGITKQRDKCYYRRKIEPANPSETPNSSDAKPLRIPNGWRELKGSEMPKITDLYERAGIWCVRDNDSSIEYARYHVRHIRKIETANPSENPNSSTPDPGEGYRLLSKDPPEPLRQGVDFWDPVVKKWKRSYVADQGAKYQRCEYYYRCKIEPANPSETPNSSDSNPPETPNFSKGDLLVDTTIKFKDGSQVVPSLPAGWTPEPDAYIGYSCVLTVPYGWMLLHSEAKTEPRVVGDMFYRITKGQWEELTEANVEQANNQNWTAIRKMPSVVVEYREPTYADLANGPIEVEVSDDKTYETNWKKRMLYAVLPECCAFPFVVANTSDELYTNSYRHARIKVC